MADLTGALTLADLLTASGVNPGPDLAIIRHAYRADGLRDAADATAARVLEYTRVQEAMPGKARAAFAATKWLIFIADGGRRARLFAAYENLGEVPDERTEQLRSFDLRESDVLASLRGRLVIDWGRGALAWVRSGDTAASFPVIEIADPAIVPFPGFDSVCIGYDELQLVMEDSRYRDWRAALRSVKGVYLIADSTGPGRLYVGKADGVEGILGRWSQYARDGHGGNVALREISNIDPTHAGNYTFSILRVLGTNAAEIEIDAAESHYKNALLTRQFGHNAN